MKKMYSYSCQSKDGKLSLFSVVTFGNVRRTCLVIIVGRWRVFFGKVAARQIGDDDSVLLCHHPVFGEQNVIICRKKWQILLLLPNLKENRSLTWVCLNIFCEEDWHRGRDICAKFSLLVAYLFTVNSRQVWFLISSDWQALLENYSCSPFFPFSPSLCILTCPQTLQLMVFWSTNSKQQVPFYADL